MRALRIRAGVVCRGSKIHTRRDGGSLAIRTTLFAADEGFRRLSFGQELRAAGRAARAPVDDVHALHAVARRVPAPSRSFGIMPPEITPFRHQVVDLLRLLRPVSSFAVLVEQRPGVFREHHQLLGL